MFTYRRADLAPRRENGSLVGRPAAETRVVYTGHPPVAQQIANQVRTGSGFTYGVATPDGARLAFVRPAGALRAPEPVAPPEPPPAAKSAVYRDALPGSWCEALLRHLRQMERDGGALQPTRYGRMFSHHWLGNLHAMQGRGVLTFWRNEGRFVTALAVRLAGSDIVMKSDNVPAYVSL